MPKRRRASRSAGPASARSPRRGATAIATPTIEVAEAAPAPRAGAALPTYRILSLDGGGIRGIISAVWLDALERALGSPIARHFNIIAGTSTGSILACMLASGHTAEEVIRLYATRGLRIFPPWASRVLDRLGRTLRQGPSAPKYGDDGLEAELRDALGPGLRFGDLRPLVMVVAYNTFQREAKVFKSNRPEEDYAATPAWEIVKSSCSAPTYFPAHVLTLSGVRHPMIDGGVAANNPTACAIAEGVREQSKLPARLRVPLERFEVASFGTGGLTRPISASNAREWGALEWAIPIIDVLMDGAADATHYVAKHVLSPDRYTRAQTDLLEAYDDMDDASPTNINALMSVARGWLEKGGGRELLDRLAHRLMHEPRAKDAPMGPGMTVG